MVAVAGLHEEQREQGADDAADTAVEKMAARILSEEKIGRERNPEQAEKLQKAELADHDARRVIDHRILAGDLAGQRTDLGLALAIDFLGIAGRLTATQRVKIECLGFVDLVHGLLSHVCAGRLPRRS